MAHRAQMEFVRSVVDRYPHMFAGTRVLEIGSRNINGSVRRFFRDCQYIGIDAVPGPCVDVVCLAHEYALSVDAWFDVVISCEAFEHDPYLDKTIDRAMTLLSLGGLFVATWAGPNRPEHGTNRTEEGAFGPDGEYYRGFSSSELVARIGDRLTHIDARDVSNGLDAQLVGIRA